jgi:FkbM family methyltransferase
MRVPWRREAPELTALVRQLPPGAVAIDCGANVGDVTAALARACSEVTAFEPNPVAFAVLERRFRKARNVRLIQAAVGASAGTRSLYLHERHEADPLGASIGSSLYSGKLNVDAERWIEVEVVDLDRFVETMGRPVDLLKLDVEGSEIEVLERLLSTGRLTSIGRVVVEMHDGVIPELADRGALLRAELADRDYAHVTLDWG